MKKSRFAFIALTNEKGVSSVEFALVLPLFLILFFGIIEYGWLMTQQIFLCHAVSEGARTAIKMPDGMSDEELAAEAKDAAIEAFTPVGTIEEDDITVEIREEETLYGSLVPRRVFVQVPAWTYTPLIGYMPDAMLPDALEANVIFAFP